MTSLCWEFGAYISWHGWDWFQGTYLDGYHQNLIARDFKSACPKATFAHPVFGEMDFQAFHTATEAILFLALPLHCYLVINAGRTLPESFAADGFRLSEAG